MRSLLYCRRTFIAALGIVASAGIGLYTHSADVVGAISMIAMGLAAANAYEGSNKASATYTNAE